MNEETLIVAIIAISLFAGFLTWEDKKRNGSKKHNKETKQKRHNEL